MCDCSIICYLCELDVSAFADKSNIRTCSCIWHWLLFCSFSRFTVSCWIYVSEIGTYTKLSCHFSWESTGYCWIDKTFYHMLLIRFYLLAVMHLQKFWHFDFVEFCGRFAKTFSVLLFLLLCQLIELLPVFKFQVWKLGLFVLLLDSGKLF
jgi:hypothetical protein